MDAKNFYGALDDFDFALKRLPAEAQIDRARLLSGASCRWPELLLLLPCLASESNPGDPNPTRATLCCPAWFLFTGRGLAYEGLGDWPAALKDYNSALQVAEAAGQLPDPYVLNSRGNCHSSLGEDGWVDMPSCGVLCFGVHPAAASPAEPAAAVQRCSCRAAHECRA